MATNVRLLGNGRVSALPQARPSQVRDTFPHPTLLRGSSYTARVQTYEQLYLYYSNKAFDELRDWSSYRRKYGLYVYTRGIFNPFTRLVDFYVDHIYPGSIADKGETEHSNGISSSIPLSHDTPPEIRQALDVLWRWSNWQQKQALMVTYGAMTGNCLVEVVDNVFDGKVSFRVWFPSYVKDFVLNDDGELVYYELEYPVEDKSNGTTYTYTKQVSRSSIRTLRDGQETSNVTNPYPFVPAVWVKHIDIGNDFGVSALKGSQTKVDELNSMVSHTIDHVHKLIKSPRILWTDSTVKSLFREDPLQDVSEIDVRGDITMLKGAKGGNTETLVGNLDPATIIPTVAEMIREIEKDFPELTFYDKLREQNIVTSPGAKMLIGDVEKKVKRPAANYDTASRRLFAMALAIAGWRANLPAEEGGWIFGKSKLSGQQQTFESFNFDLYSDGELDVAILPRPLIQETSREEAEQLQIRGQGIASLESTLPLRERLKWLGYKEDEIPGIIEELNKEVEEATKRERETLSIRQQSQAANTPDQQRQ